METVHANLLTQIITKLTSDDLQDLLELVQDEIEIRHDEAARHDNIVAGPNDFYDPDQANGHRTAVNG